MSGDILDLIDAAVEDWETSPDAARYNAPAPAETFTEIRFDTRPADTPAPPFGAAAIHLASEFQHFMKTSPHTGNPGAGLSNRLGSTGRPAVLPGRSHLLKPWKGCASRFALPRPGFAGWRTRSSTPAQPATTGAAPSIGTTGGADGEPHRRSGTAAG